MAANTFLEMRFIILLLVKLSTLPMHNTTTAAKKRFFKVTAQTMKADLQKNHLQFLEHFKVNAKDRIYICRL